MAHRFRFINISPLESSTIRLLAGDDIQSWRALAKDGADLPPHQATLKPSVLVLHPGETYDFEVIRQRPETLTMTVNSPGTIAVRLDAVRRGVVASRQIMTIPVIVR